MPIEPDFPRGLPHLPGEPAPAADGPLAASAGSHSSLPLHPDHLADLRERSALSAETILTAGIRSLAPAEWPRYLSQRLAAKVQSCYLIPYADADGFYRVKLFPPVPDADGPTLGPLWPIPRFRS